MRVALVGCRKVGTWPVAATEQDPRPWERDDQPLYEALRGLGADVVRPDWDDPGFRYEDVDVALIRATWDYHHRRDEFLAWVERVSAATTLLNPAAVVRWNVDKRYLRDLAVPQIETRWLDVGDAPALAERTAGWEQAFFKPVVGATAEGTLRFGRSAEELARAEAHVAAWLPRGGGMLQPYVPSVETAGERSAVVVDGRITHWVRKIPVPGDYRVQDDYGATDEAHAPSPAERDLGEAVLAALPAGVVYARIDWLVLPDGPKLIELELVEPCLFFRHGPAAAEALARAVLARARA